MSCSGFILLTLAALLIQLTGLSFFIFGFFPIKPALSGFSGPESFQAPWNDSDDIVRDDTTLPPDQRRILYQELSMIPASFDRLVLMVIDGLPAEFVLGKGGLPPKKDFMEAMPYMQSLLNLGLALGVHSKAAPPTVTMPRLKAMVSGAIAGFLDVVYNFNTQALQDDNLIDQLFSTGRKLVMHGDNTWLKLFPGLFDRYDGVSSFFVRDTIQVDQNVSRHLRDELTRDDWDVLILHYLGLDHVGHTGGRSSFLMCPKLKEMDEVIQMIHSSATRTQKEERKHTLLVIVSDHGMTEEGNHGGSSYEETDSLAIFVGPRDDVPEFAAENWKTELTVDQVDIAPTLAILFSVPIPKNNVGVLMLDTINFLSEEQQLRALELNSWQLLRLLKAQLSDLECRQLPQELNECTNRTKMNFCCLYQRATFLHNSWRSKKNSMSNNRKDYTNVVEAYSAFLKTTSKWLSRRVTDKPMGQLAFGVAAILLSCSIFLCLSFHLYKEIYFTEGGTLTKKTKNRAYMLHLDEAFIIVSTVLHNIGMASSSMVEEEQYIWHFLLSTHFLLLLRKSVKALPENRATRIYSILVILISGRFLRGWHQGGINWTNLPDISKWLELRGQEYVKSTQLVACLLVIFLSFGALCHLKTKRNVIIATGLSLLGPSYLVLTQLISYQETSSATLLAQKFYFLVGVLSAGAVAVIPWLMLTVKADKCVGCGFHLLTTFPHDKGFEIPLQVIKDSLYVIGWVLVFCWCLLQLLLQQPINAMPIFFLLVQIYASMIYSSNAAGPSNRQWVQVAVVYFMGMAGHYGLGNSNSLATIDVAGAFIGTSSYSTLISGILMFMITYASPMLFLISMTMQIAGVDISVVTKNPNVDLLKTLLGFPCLIPLTLNSLMLASYTVIMLLMRNHLFVWSVFSPKYLYVSATTVCVDVGVAIVAATGSYTYAVSAAAYRKERSHCSKCRSKEREEN